MNLTEEQRNIIIRRLTELSPQGMECPICHNHQWAINDIVTEMRDFNPNGLVVGGPIIPFVTLQCTKCPNTIFLNAIRLGIIDQTSNTTPNTDER